MHYFIARSSFVHLFSQKAEVPWTSFQKPLDRVWEEIQTQGQVAIDLESDNYHAYRPKICLIQLAVSDAIYLIDPLRMTKRDWNAFGSILGDSQLLKIMHGSSNDLILFQELSLKIRHFFDTQEAASLLNIKGQKLYDLFKSQLQLHQKIPLPTHKFKKRYQKFNWAQRPLKREALTYAALDVAYLSALKVQLSQKLRAKGLLQACYQNSQALASHPPRTRAFNPNQFLRIKGGRTLTPHQLALLKALYLWRHRVCLRKDQSHLFVMTNREMLNIVLQEPHHLRSLGKIYPKQKYLKRQVLRVIESCRGQELKLPPMPAPKTQPKAQSPKKRLLSQLKQWRESIAQRDQIPAEKIATNKILENLIKRKPKALSELNEVEGMLPWRICRYGEDLLEILTHA